jgi:hypothetical protein
MPELRALVGEREPNDELNGARISDEARLKGTGMHRARQHINPLLGLRNALCNEC